MPVQLGVPIDPGDCKSTGEGVSQHREQQGGAGSSRAIAPRDETGEGETITALQEELPAKTKLFAAPEPFHQLENLLSCCLSLSCWPSPPPHGSVSGPAFRKTLYKGIKQPTEAVSLVKDKQKRFEFGMDSPSSTEILKTTLLDELY